MSDLPAIILSLLNLAASAIGEIIFAPIGSMPGWLSNTVASALLGAGMLVIYKHTSNQAAIGRVRDAIKADILTLKLFKDSLPVTLAAQGRMFKGAGLSFVYALPPLAAMMIPVILFLSQLGLWYQHAPLAVGKRATVAMQLNAASDAMPQVTLQESPAFEIIDRLSWEGPRLRWWTIKALQPGQHTMVFDMDGQPVTKTLAIGEGLMRINKLRPDMSFMDVMLNPAERPFAADSPVQSIDIDYRQRPEFISGTDTWVIYLFIASIVFSLLLKGPLGVRL